MCHASRESFVPFTNYALLVRCAGHYTACGHRMAYRKWKETKQQLGTAEPGNMLGCRLISFHVGHPEHEHCIQSWTKSLAQF